MSNKWLFFDCFGVLIDSLVTEGRNFKISAAQIDEIQEKVFNKLDRGAMSDEDALIELSKIVGCPGEEFIREVFAEKATLNTDLIEWIKQNDQKYHIALLSNAAPLYLDPIFKLHNLDTLFEKMFISHDYKITKPSPSFYMRALAEANCQPQNAIMIDDRVDNITAARNVGMHGIVFDNTDDAIAQIKTIFPD